MILVGIEQKKSDFDVKSPINQFYVIACNFKSIIRSGLNFMKSLLTHFSTLD